MTTMTAEQAADYIFDNIDAFKAKHANTITKFESKGIDHQMALAMTITIAANAKAVTDAIKADMQ